MVATGATSVDERSGRGARLRTWLAGFRLRDTWSAYAFLSPWMFGFLVFTLGPMIASLVLSFTNYDIISRAKFVGLANYQQLLHDPSVATALKNTLIYTVLNVPLTMIFGLFLAMMLARVGRGSSFFRTVFYLPVMTPAVAAGILYLLLFNGTSGLVDHALGLVGIPGPYWTTDPRWIKPGLVLMSLWSVGANVVIYLAAIRGVPERLYEAAAMDGASAWRRFRDVTLPMISPALFFTFIVLTISGLQTFTQAYTAFFNSGTGAGASSSAALFYVIYLFQQAFSYLHMGYASALAWLLFAVIGVVTVLQVVGSRRFIYYEGSQRR